MHVKVEQSPCLQANLSALILDYCARQKHSGASLKYHVVTQLPVAPPAQYDEDVVGVWEPNWTMDDCAGAGVVVLHGIGPPTVCAESRRNALANIAQRNVLLHLAFPTPSNVSLRAATSSRCPRRTHDELSNQTGARDRDHNGTSVRPDRALAGPAVSRMSYCPPLRFPTAPTHDSRSTNDGSPWGH
jgi:hypothetical protein